VDLDHLNEEIRTRVYLSYFSNARSQIDEQRRKIAFLQRLHDEESGDAHFRINAQQVFGDPLAYKKLMPWIETLMEIVTASEKGRQSSGSMGDLIKELLVEEHRITTSMEEGLNHLREGFATGGRTPLTLIPVKHAFPVDWTIVGFPFTWHASQANDREPLLRVVGQPKAMIEIPLYICSVCQRFVAKG
jgi:hypothetical protein